MESQAFAMNAPMPEPSDSSDEDAYIKRFMESDAMQKEFPDKHQRLGVAYSKWREGKNAAKNNAAVDHQPIRSAHVELPVIMEGVLAYKPGELGTSTTLGRQGGRVFYPKEAISDPEFLESIMRAPYSVETHEKNTSEANRQEDGSSYEVWYDPNKKGTYVKGYVRGTDNVQYVIDNKLKPGFGTSAFIRFLELKPQRGTAPDGSEYDMIATKLSCGHLAILENVRDKKNVIVAINALQEHEDVSTTLVIEKSLSVRNSGGSMEGKDLKGAVKDAMNELSEEKSREEKYTAMENSLKAANEELEQLRGEKNARNAEEEAKKKEQEAANAAEEDKKDEAENAKNAIASEGLIADAAEILRTTFKVPPTLVSLAKDFDIDTKGKSKLQLATALNAKIAEHKKPLAEATNSTESSWEALTKAL